MITRISPHEAALRLEQGWLYVDVRDDVDFAEAHPRGAICVPYVRDATRFVTAVRAKAGSHTKLVLGCYTGLYSVHAAEMLEQAGFEVVEQRAGFDGTRGTYGELVEPGWARAGLPVASEDDE